MLRYGVDPIIFLINNGGYTIEVEIHDVSSHVAQYGMPGLWAYGSTHRLHQNRTARVPQPVYGVHIGKARVLCQQEAVTVCGCASMSKVTHCAVLCRSCAPYLQYSCAIGAWQCCAP